MILLHAITPVIRRIFEVSRSRWWQLVAGPLIAAIVALLVVLKAGDRELAFTLVPVCAALGFVAVVMLMLRDLGWWLGGRGGGAALTPKGYVGMGAASVKEFDEAAVLSEIVRKVGRPMRAGTQVGQMYRTPPRPRWLEPGDLISLIYKNYPNIVNRGEVRWAAVIHANSTLFAPGEGDSGAQVVYAPAGAPLARVRA